MSQLPARFVDYIVFPDRDGRSLSAAASAPFRQRGVNGLGPTWRHQDAGDMKPEQVDDFERGMRTSIENVLHGWWRKRRRDAQHGAVVKRASRNLNEVVR